ncbi:MAG: hypothetical protein LBV59_24160 [Sphingobacterium sp.]|jgi:hypothetical protein|nr:hypothetical protein [Sphingobacterium sp.]MDR3011042.1 hypothetical protein [Sphingobacterium sp.]
MSTNEYTIKFSLWEMSEFVRTNKKYGIDKLVLSELYEALYPLVEDGILVKLVLGGSLGSVSDLKAT